MSCAAPLRIATHQSRVFSKQCWKVVFLALDRKKELNPKVTLKIIYKKKIPWTQHRWNIYSVVFTEIRWNCSFYLQQCGKRVGSYLSFQLMNNLHREKSISWQLSFQIQLCPAVWLATTPGVDLWFLNTETESDSAKASWEQRWRRDL